MNKKERKNVSYTAQFIMILAVILMSGVTFYFGCCLHADNIKLATELNNVKEPGDTAVIMNTVDTQQSSSLSEAISLMQGQYDSYGSNLSLILTVFIAGLTIFSIAVPILNYNFFQKDQVQAINKHMDEWEKSLADIQKNFDTQFDRLKKAIALNQNVTSAIADTRHEAQIQPISNTNEDRAYSSFLSGLLLSRKCEYNNAVKYLKKAINLDPENAQYHDGLSVTLHKMGRYNEAEAESRKAVELDPENAQYHDGLGITLHAMKRYKDAEVEQRKAVELEPENPRYHDSLSTTLHTMKRYKEAEVESRKAVKLEPENAGYYFSHGVALLTMGRNEKAETENRKAVELDPENPRYHHSLSATLFAMGRNEEAETENRKAVDLGFKE